MSTNDEKPRRPWVRNPLATQDAVAREPAPFPSVSSDEPNESSFADWRKRLARNLSRRSDGRWDPLTRIHADERDTDASERVL